MRRAVALCLTCFVASAAAAETLTVPARISEVTVFPQGAAVTRHIAFSAPAGTHTLLVPDLPAGISITDFSVLATAGVTVGALTIATGPTRATDDDARPEVTAARAEVERLEAVVRDRDSAAAAIRARAGAAEAQERFLASIGTGDSPAAASAEALQAIGRMIAADVLAARQAALVARAEADTLDRDGKEDRAALDRARAALDGLTSGGEGAVITVTVTKATDGPAALDLLTQVPEAGWAPIYDLRLTRGATPALTADRAILVAQYSGEDWLDVQLVFSTAAPGSQTEPGTIWAHYRRIVSQADLDRENGIYGDKDGQTGGFAPVVVEPSVIVEEAGSSLTMAGLERLGGTVTYRFPDRIDLRSEVDVLRLSLDQVALTPTLRAVGAPDRDTTAYLVATLKNISGEPLLPGSAKLWLDGAQVGDTALDLLAAGATTDIGFGPLHGLILKRTVPDRTEGDRGVLSRSNEASETAILTVENLTDEAWPVRLIDSVPYSEQDDLEIDITATPDATEQDLDGRRGILAWDFDLAPGETRRIEVRSVLSWPTGYVLQ